MGHQDSELAGLLRRSLALEREVPVQMVILVLPSAKLQLRFLEGAEADPTVKLLSIGPVAPPDFPVPLGVPPGDIAVTDAEIVQVPREV